MLNALKQRFRTWLFRPRIEQGTITLTQRRIFIIPTKQSFKLSLVLAHELIEEVAIP